MTENAASPDTGFLRKSAIFVWLQSSFARTLAAIVAFSVVAGIWVFVTNAKADYFISLSGVDNIDHVQASIETTGGNITPLPLHQDEGIIYNENKNLRFAPPYILLLSLTEDPAGKNTGTVRLNVDRAQNRIVYTLSGFDPAARISLRGNRSSYESGLKPDWAGRIELETAIVPKENILCLIVENRGMDRAPLTLCHHLADRAGA